MRWFRPHRADDVLTPDLCVIGAGAAGCAAALTGVALGAATVIVEAERPGGERVAFDAPFAVWREAARRRAESGRGEAWARIAARARQAAARAQASCSAERLAAAGARLIAGHARFVAPDALSVGGVAIAARRFIVATGRAPVLPTLPGLDLLRPLSPADALTLDDMPDRLAILGAGATGLALAQTFARLGARVIVVDRGPALRELAREFADPALRRLRAEGVEIREEAAVAGVEPVGGEGAARLLLNDGECVKASHLVVATGWRANVQGLGLETTGARSGPEGMAVRGDLRSAARRIFVAGAAAAGAAPDAEGAARAGRLAARAALLGLPGDARLDAAPDVWPLDPAVARLGVDRRPPNAALAGPRVLRASFGEDDAAFAAGRREGHLALSLDHKGKLVGATLVGSDIGAATAALSLALTRGLDAAALADAPLPGFGGLAATMRALGVEQARRARSPAVARLMRWRWRWT